MDSIRTDMQHLYIIIIIIMKVKFLFYILFLIYVPQIFSLIYKMQKNMILVRTNTVALCIRQCITRNYFLTLFKKIITETNMRSFQTCYCYIYD